MYISLINAEPITITLLVTFWLLSSNIYLEPIAITFCIPVTAVDISKSSEASLGTSADVLDVVSITEVSLSPLVSQRVSIGLGSGTAIGRVVSDTKSA